MSARAARPARPRGSRGEAGGAVTLMVMLMVPVCVLAAVVAAAAPRRLAAEAAAEAAADSLASLAVAWRGAQGSDHGPVSRFFPDCAAPSGKTPADGSAALDLELQRACEALTESVLAGLSARGVDGTTVEGFYSSAYTASAHTTAENGEHTISLPCHAGGRAIIADAVHLGLAADWATTDWAAGQVWPQGLRLGAESVGTIRVLAADGAIAEPECGDAFSLVPPDATPQDRNRARQIAETLPTRTAFGH